MGAIYKKILKPLLFRDDADHVHERAIYWLHVFGHFKPLLCLMEKFNTPRHAEAIHLFGLEFPNAVGLAAGFDKDALCWTVMRALGFGHVEIGTVTHLEQPGNQRPRIVRVPEYDALINRMGFPSDGADVVAKRLAKQRLHNAKRKFPLGINIGKSKICPNAEAAEDYIASFNRLADHADYFTINVSSPNTVNLRALQEHRALNDLLGALKKANDDRSKKLGKPRIPMLVKVAPDLSYRQLDEILEVLYEQQFDGIVATNTTISRPGALADNDAMGGLSGRPLHPLSLDMVRYIHKATSGKLPIIGSGGIMDAVSACKMFDAGASLVQIYTGLIYGGPFFAKEIAQSLVWQHTSKWV